MSVNLVTAHLTQNRMAAKDVSEFIREIHSTLTTLRGNVAAAPQREVCKTATLAAPVALAASKVPADAPAAAP